jgi:hypothetical protein
VPKSPPSPGCASSPTWRASTFGTSSFFLEASRRFWEGVAPPLGLQVEEARFEGMVAIAANGRHLMLVADGRPPTTGVRIEVAAEAPLAAVTDPDGNVAEAP